MSFDYFSQPGSSGRSFAFEQPSGRNFGFMGQPTQGGRNFSVLGGGPHRSMNMLGKIEGFAASAIETFPEMFGIEPTASTQVFRAQNPVSGFISQMVGTGAFYGVGASIVNRTPALAGLVTRAGSAFKSPWAQTAARWATEAAIIEGGRLAIAATPLASSITGRERTKSLGELSLDSAANIAGGAVIGGVWGGVRSMLPQGRRIMDYVPGADPSQPVVARARALDEALQTPGAFDEGVAAMLRNERGKLIKANLEDIQPVYNRTGQARIDVRDPDVRRARGSIARSLVGDTRPRNNRQLSMTATLNRVFDWTRPRTNESGASRLFKVDPAEGFASEGELASAVERLGIPLDELALRGQDHRFFSFGRGDRAAPVGQPPATPRIHTTPPKSSKLEPAARFDRRITGKGPFTRMGDDFFVAREEDNGLWVVAKKINGTVGKGGAEDQWYFGRFDDIDSIAPKDALFRELTINRAAYWPKAAEYENIGVASWDAMQQFSKVFGDVLTAPRQVAARLNPFVSRARDINDVLGAYVKPTAVLAGRNLKAGYAVNAIKTLETMEDQFVKDIVGGQRVLRRDQSLARQVASIQEPTQAGLADLAKTLDVDDWRHVQDALETELPYAQMETFADQGIISPRAASLLRELVKIDLGQQQGFERLRGVTTAGSAVDLLGKFNPREGHYGISRQRTGGVNAYIEDEAGRLVGWVAHNSAKEARDSALGIIKKEFAERGRDLRFAGFSDNLLRSAEGYDRFTRAIREPNFIKARGDTLGYDLQRDGLSAENFIPIVERNVRDRQRLMTNVVLNEHLAPVLQGLENEDASLAVQIRKRLQILQGDEGQFARFQNAAVDKVLSPILGGSNWASQTTQGIQRLMSLFQFGLNLGHAAMQAVSIAQTIAPEAALLLRSAGKDLTDYATAPSVNARGEIDGVINYLSDIKLMNSAFGLVGKPFRELPEDFQELVQDMTQRGLLAPRYSEGNGGSQSSYLRNFLEGKNITAGDWWNTLTGAAEILAAKSDEFTRLMAVATGYRLTKALSIDDPFRRSAFVREFLSKTTFNYGTIDRPTVFTTPLGSLAGTFKTWMFHYIANMVRYAGEAGRGNVAPLLWQTAATAVVGGSVATPFLEPIANGVSKWATDRSFMDMMYNEWFEDNERVADGIMYGVPGILGVSLAAQASSPGADPVRDASMLWSFAVWDRMRGFGRATGSAIEAYKATGRSPLEDDNVRGQLARALAPRSLYRALAASEAGSIKSLTNGYRVVDNISLGSAALYAAGFNPVGLDKTYAAYEEVRNSQEGKRKLTAELGRAMADALESGDNALATRVYTRALATGVSVESVMRSAKARVDRGQQTQLEFALGKDDAAGTWDFDR